MKHQAPSLVSVGNLAVIDARHLARRDENQRTLPVIVLVTPVEQRPTVEMLEENTVKTEVFQAVADILQFRKIDDAYQRMQGFHAQQLVVVLYRIQFYDRSHVY